MFLPKALCHGLIFEYQSLFSPAPPLQVPWPDPEPMSAWVSKSLLQKLPEPFDITSQLQVTIRQRLGVDAVCRITGLAREDAVQQIYGTMVMADYLTSHEFKSTPSMSLHIPLWSYKSCKSHILTCSFLKMSTPKPNLSELGHLEVWIQLFQMDVGCVVAIADVQQHLAQHKTGNKSATSSLRA